MPLHTSDLSASDVLAHLPNVAKEKSESYRTATPFPHCAIQNLFPDTLLEEVVSEFPSQAWTALNNPQYSQQKTISKGVEDFGPATRRLFSLLSSPRFLQFLEELTGVRGLMPDPYLYAAGLHEIKTGGFLALHSDFNHNAHLGIYRRVNVLLYLNKDWRPEYEGALELWDLEMQQSASYLPSWNNTIIHNVTADCIHGFPQKIQCPEHMTRKLAAAWYYTRDIPLDEQAGYDMFDPAFLASPTTRPKNNTLLKLVPPAFVSLWRMLRGANTRGSHKADILRAASRFLPPVLVKALTSKPD